jgi:serine/threonine protein kinase
VDNYKGENYYVLDMLFLPPPIRAKRHSLSSELARESVRQEDSVMRDATLLISSLYPVDVFFVSWPYCLSVPLYSYSLLQIIVMAQQIPFKSSRWVAALVTGVASTAAVFSGQNNKQVKDEEYKEEQEPKSSQYNNPLVLSELINRSDSFLIKSSSHSGDAPLLMPFLDSRLCKCQQANTNKPSSVTKFRAALQRKRTVQQMAMHSTKASLESKYIWHKKKVLGEGAYGSVFLATSRITGEDVALKEISKKYTNSVNFQQEMRTMLYIKSKGGHPHLCSLHEHFDSSRSYYVILDYIGGGEMFDHLINNGAYSELDASRLVREVAGALNFLHGIGVVHADLKPENILLTTSRRGDSLVKLADFGCAQISTNTDTDLEDYDHLLQPTYGTPTPAYCPPESLLKTHPIQPSCDMWGLGVILFIMLTGAHPYDLSGEASDQVIEDRIKDQKYKIPIHDSLIAGHVSESAKDLIGKLMERDPKKRLTAFDMLQHPWVRGETATTKIIAGSDTKLSKFRHIKTKLQQKFFEDAIEFSDTHDHDILRKTSLIERSFKALDMKELMAGDPSVVEEDGGPKINLSDFQNLLSDNMKNKYFPAGHVVYREGDAGHHMYFIDSGEFFYILFDLYFL